jgi:Cu(I)/Ag(I) efflux system membrane fusion protein
MTRPARLARVPLLALLALAALALPLLACGEEHAHDVTGWHCPMHPTYTSDRPGDCPICGMRLVPIEGGQAAAAPTPGAERGVVGQANVESGAAGIRLAGVRTAPAERGRLGRTTRTVGVVVADERRVRRVQTKIAGWVERLHVGAEGDLVRAGQPILAIYSPELLASQEELLRAREVAARFESSSLPEVRRGGADLVTAARRRLELFDVPRSFIDRLERTGAVQRTVTLVAPASGFVSAKTVFQGMEVSPGMELFTLTDLSRVWVEAEFYEYEAHLLRPGQRVAVRLPYDAGRAIEAEVALVYPTLSPQSRTVKARLELPNPDGQLRPGAFVDVTTELAAAEGVLVPDDAVIDSGLRQIVFVEREPGVFEPREVRLGVRGEGRAVVLSGVAEGERVATHANFLLDSESKLRGALAALAPGAPAAGATPPGAHPGGH